MDNEVEPYAKPETADALIAAWAARDDLYSRSSKPLSADAEAAIREGRKREAKLLPDPHERARAWASAKTWYAPEHGQ